MIPEKPCKIKDFQSGTSKMVVCFWVRAIMTTSIRLHILGSASITKIPKYIIAYGENLCKNIFIHFAFEKRKGEENAAQYLYFFGIVHQNYRWQ